MGLLARLQEELTAARVINAAGGGYAQYSAVPSGLVVPLPQDAPVERAVGALNYLLAWALRPRRAEWTRTAREEVFAEAGSLFREVARATHYSELERAIAAAADRLAAFRIAEQSVLEHLTGELTSLQLCIRENDDGRLRRELASYHKRRQRAAPLILAAACREPDRHRET